VKACAHGPAETLVHAVALVRVLARALAPLLTLNCCAPPRNGLLLATLDDSRAGRC
jgi:hypothetical protein